MNQPKYGYMFGSVNARGPWVRIHEKFEVEKLDRYLKLLLGWRFTDDLDQLKKIAQEIRQEIKRLKESKK